MERQNSAIATGKTQMSPPSGSPVSPTTTTTTPLRRRKARHQNWVLFGILRTLAVVGPFGFVANVVYFQFYFHQSAHHSSYPQLHPLHAISEGVRDRYDHHRLMTGRDDNNESDNSPEDRPTVLSGTAVLKRLQKQAAISWKECESSPKATLALVKQLQNEPPNRLRASSTKAGLLKPFALLEALDSERAPRGEEATVNKTATTGTDRCMIPQPGSLECEASTYSIVVTFQGEKNFRALFMNLLSWLTYPFVADIVVLMPHNDWGYEGQSTMDVKYKNRLKAWHGNKEHKVSMIGLPATLQDEPKSRYSLNTIMEKVMAKVNSKAVLFMDGSILWNGNLRGAQAGFELWKQNPHAIIATHKLHTQTPTTTCPSQSSQGAVHPSSFWASFCQSQRDSIPSDISTLHQQYQNVLDMNGVFLHRDMLCLLQQAPLSTILIQSVWRVLDDSSDPRATFANVRAILATALLQISAHPPLLFPSRIARPKNETKDYNDNWHYLPPRKEKELLDAVIANNTLAQQKVLVSLLGYFGTGLATDADAGIVPYWCTSQKEVDDVFFMSDISWAEGGIDSKC